MPETFVIVGANLAGGSAALGLRQEGFDGRIVLIGAEPQLPYERPPLSKQYLRGEMPVDKMLLQPADFYASNSIETLLGVPATLVDPAGKVVELADGRLVPYDNLLIATGGRNRRLSIPGIDLEGVHDLRTIADTDRIRSEAQPGARVVVVGMGFIGSEVAASLSEMGLDVTVVEGLDLPLGGALGEELSRLVESVHRDHGVKMHFGDFVEAFEGDGRVQSVVTRNGQRLECDFVVFGVGIEPVTDLLTDTDVSLDNGIVVDEYCRTSLDGVFAAGDVANHFHPLLGRHIRVEHWQNAMRQGTAAAKSMMGRGEPYREVHWFWSDQFNLHIQYAGFHGEADELVTRGNPEDREFVTFYLQHGVMVAAVAVNRARDLRRAIPLIASQRLLDVPQLQDESVDLRSLE